jgi:periplasmic protein TonB
MSSAAPGAVQVPPQLDPAARRSLRNDGEWRLWLGWVVAALVHGVLLAALIFSWPARLNPAPPNASSISLLIVPASSRMIVPAANPVAVRSKPTEEKAVIPPVAPVKIANTQIVRKVTPLPASRSIALGSAPKHPPATAPSDVVATRTVAQQDRDGFVAAQPMAGSGNQPPEYPLQAQQHGEQGDVLLSIHVLPDGAVDSVSVTQSSGYAVLDEAAAKAVWNWRFQPSTLSGRPVPSVIPYRIHFSLQNAP